MPTSSRWVTRRVTTSYWLSTIIQDTDSCSTSQQSRLQIALDPWPSLSDTTDATAMHRLRLIRSDPDKPLLAAADLLEDKFRGLKMRHANPEEHERVFENFYKTIKGDTICIKEQLPYE